MNDTTSTCESCGLPIEAGPYCQHCIDEHGNLQTFEERLERMSQWMRRSHDGLSEADARARALDYMATMPAWRKHPALRNYRAQKSSR